MKKILLFIWEVIWRTIIFSPALLFFNESGDLKINLFGLFYIVILMVLYKTKVLQSLFKYIKTRCALRYIIAKKIPLRLYDSEELFLIYDNVDRKIYWKYFVIGKTYANTPVYDIIGRVSDLLEKYNIKYEQQEK